MVLVEGAIVDALGARAGYVRFERGRIVETGQLGTDSTRGRGGRIRGIVVPAPVNGHTHLGDAVATREPPNRPLAELVRPPTGWKFRLLASAGAPQKVSAMRGALHRMARERVAATVDFREEGVEGLAALRAAQRRVPVEVVALGRPLARPLDPRELAALLKVGDGIGLSSALEEPPEVLTEVGRACRSSGKHFALHASEEVREDPSRYLAARPDLLVHLTEASPEDLERVAAEGVRVAVCPRSNALFGRRPDLARLEATGVRLLIGTDNAMFHAPSLWRELEFAYVSARLARRPVTPRYLVRAACVEPWEWLGRPERARIEAGAGEGALVLRLPPDDPEYQVVARATEHLIVRPGSRPRGGGRRG